MLLAVAIFEHCSVVFYELNFKSNELTFIPLKKEMRYTHKIPLKTIRMSKKTPNMLVTCGDEADVTIKLWNIGVSLSEPVTQTNTSQIKHKYMTQGHG